jgi:hypothetical protein
MRGERVWRGSSAEQERHTELIEYIFETMNRFVNLPKCLLCPIVVHCRLNFNQFFHSSLAHSSLIQSKYYMHVCILGWEPLQNNVMSSIDYHFCVSCVWHCMPLMNCVSLSLSLCHAQNIIFLLSLSWLQDVPTHCFTQHLRALFCCSRQSDAWIICKWTLRVREAKRVNLNIWSCLKQWQQPREFGIEWVR